MKSERLAMQKKMSAWRRKHGAELTEWLAYYREAAVAAETQAAAYVRQVGDEQSLNHRAYWGDVVSAINWLIGFSSGAAGRPKGVHRAES